MLLTLIIHKYFCQLSVATFYYEITIIFKWFSETEYCFCRKQLPEAGGWLQGRKIIVALLYFSENTWRWNSRNLRFHHEMLRIIYLIESIEMKSNWIFLMITLPFWRCHTIIEIVFQCIWIDVTIESWTVFDIKAFFFEWNNW